MVTSHGRPLILAPKAAIRTGGDAAAAAVMDAVAVLKPAAVLAARLLQVGRADHRRADGSRNFSGIEWCGKALA
jgi:hypothetical protein